MTKQYFAFKSGEDLKYDTQNEDIDDLQEILSSLGYLGGSYEAGKICRRTERAIKRYQRFFELKADGIVGPITRELLESRRCGVADYLDNNSAVSTYVLSNCKYHRRNLTFAFVNGTSDLAGDRELHIVRSAFATWQEVCGLAFSQVHINASPDFRISWRSGNHGDGYAFDGPSNTLAHAFFPPPCGGAHAGNLHFDEAETWVESGAGIVLLQVAIHEIGHLLGLRHSQNNAAIMFPYYSAARVSLAQDDIDGIQELYGKSEPDLQPLELTASSNGSLDQAHAQALFELEIPQTWELSIDGPQDADFDLYIRRGERPTKSDYDYRAYSASADEKITFPAAPGERYYVMVDRYSGSGDYTIRLEPSAS